MYIYLSKCKAERQHCICVRRNTNIQFWRECPSVIPGGTESLNSYLYDEREEARDVWQQRGSSVSVGDSSANVISSWPIHNTSNPLTSCFFTIQSSKILSPFPAAGTDQSRSHAVLSASSSNSSSRGRWRCPSASGCGSWRVWLAWGVMCSVGAGFGVCNVCCFAVKCKGTRQFQFGIKVNFFSSTFGKFANYPQFFKNPPSKVIVYTFVKKR